MSGRFPLVAQPSRTNTRHPSDPVAIFAFVPLGRKGTKRRREEEKGVATASETSEAGTRLGENGGHVEPAAVESPCSNGDVVDPATRKTMVKAAIAILKQVIIRYLKNPHVISLCQGC